MQIVSFVITNFLLGVGLAMDAFSVSLANGLGEPGMRRRRMALIAGVFALFQAAMPMIGWFLVHTAVTYFNAFSPFIPWISLALLGFIGGKMLLEGVRNLRSGNDEACELRRVSLGALLLQGVATSIDALSVGFTIAEYDVWHALVAVALIAAVTFVICLAGILLGKKFGAGLSCKATILGGSILVIIGLVIFIRGLLGV
ncbi:MAG: manganese efflux pump [Ruminococcaceae bacterium]|nr:manganese efflux pump [Oscillospiraceae bacterium]